MSGVSCPEFRALLGRALRGHPARGVPAELTWHEHLLSCAPCRRLLEAEEALEQVLATLPEPKLPPRLARRVLARLDRHRVAEGAASDELDRILGLDPGPRPPDGLERRVLAGLAHARGVSGAEAAEEALDRLLELAAAPPEAPPGLGERVLAGLEGARRPAPRLRLHRGAGSRTWRLAAAAALVVGLAWAVTRLGPSLDARSEEPDGAVARSRPAPEASGVDDELLASLDVLENWEVLTSNDVDALLAQLDSLEEELIELDEVPDEDPAPSSESDGERQG